MNTWTIFIQNVSILEQLYLHTFSIIFTFLSFQLQIITLSKTLLSVSIFFNTSNAKTTYVMHNVCLVLRNLQNSPGYAVIPLALSVSTCHLCR